jgi:hypothetical protein
MGRGHLGLCAESDLGREELLRWRLWLVTVSRLATEMASRHEL